MEAPPNNTMMLPGQDMLTPPNNTTMVPGQDTFASTSNSVISSLHSPEKFLVPRPPGSSSTVVAAGATSSTTSIHQASGGEGGLQVICFPNPAQSAAGSAKSKRGGRKKITDASVKQKESRRTSKTSKMAAIGLVLNANGEEEYKVERIIKKQLIDGVVHYRVKWEGWAPVHNTWEPIENLSNCRDLVNDFNASYQLDSEMKVPAQKGSSGKSLKLRPPKRPGQDDSNPLEKEEVTVATRSPVTNDGDRILNEDLDRQFMGPMFRRHWRQSEVPICILGSSNIHGDLMHLVRIKTEHDAENVLEDPYEGLDENNCVMVLAQTFNCYFPQLILNYYEARAKFARDTEKGEIKAAKAARIEILRLCRTKGIHVNEKKLFQDMLLQSTGATVIKDVAESHKSTTAQGSDGITVVGTGFSHLSLSSLKNNTASVSEMDKYGLPQSISSSDSEDNASSSEEVTKNFMCNRTRPAKRQLIESDEEEIPSTYNYVNDDEELDYGVDSDLDD